MTFIEIHDKKNGIFYKFNRNNIICIIETREKLTIKCINNQTHIIENYEYISDIKQFR